MFLNLPVMVGSSKEKTKDEIYESAPDFLKGDTSISLSDFLDAPEGASQSDLDRIIAELTPEAKTVSLDDLISFSAPSPSTTASTASSSPNLFERAMSLLGITSTGVPIGGTLAAFALASALKDRGKLSPQVPQVGYQGEIPKLTAIREQIERDDTGRRPGSAGRRYFSDVIYAKRPEGENRMTVEEARTAAKKQAEGLAGGGSVLQGGGYLEGDSDGQADLVKGNIDGVQEARLSHGEFVLPADVVAMLGNGNSDAGADALQDFMKSVRTKATGNPKQQKNIDADEVLAMLSKRAKA